MPLAKRKGWLRLGIALSLTWIVGALIYSAIDYYLINSTESGWETEGRSERGLPAESTRTSFLTRCGYEEKQALTTCSPRYSNVALLALVPLLGGWVFVTAAVFVFLWVREGFRADET